MRVRAVVPCAGREKEAMQRAFLVLVWCSTIACSMEFEEDSLSADEAALGVMAGEPHWLVTTALGDTLLRREPGDTRNFQLGVDACVLHAGTQVALDGPAVRVGNFLRVVPKQRIENCAMTTPGYIYEPHVADGSGDSGFLWHSDPQLRQTLDAIFAESSAGGARWSVDIRASTFWNDKRYILYQRSPEGGLKPASTMKIFSSWAAFETLPELRDTDSRRYDYVRDMMKRSNNDMAEVVLDWAGGQRRVQELVDERGIAASDGFEMADASGLSYDNRLAARDLVQVLLWIVRRSGYIRAFRGTLPVGGVDGTLRNRLDLPDGIVAAKTGTLRRTTALAGLADTHNGWQIVFAVLGDSVDDAAEGRATIDRAIAAVVRRVNQYD
jgi:D-alanyl-D-alanine carboxypeptidase/D-alanyl-D-alanine-endopeptidase (penicillin-binding protein 4)